MACNVTGTFVNGTHNSQVETGSNVDVCFCVFLYSDFGRPQAAIVAYGKRRFEIRAIIIRVTQLVLRDANGIGVNFA